jgi:glutamyl-tRNA synthetase
MEGEVEFRDDLMGPQREVLEATTGDIVVRRSDGVIAYQLAVVVDDAEQSVTHVVRGADLLASTARQIRLYDLLGLAPAPGYAHVPLLLGDDGERLAKRHGAVGLTELREAGVDARAVVGRLAFSAGLLDAPGPCTAAALLERFDPAALEREPTRTDPASLHW